MKTRDLTRMALLTALALIIFVVEAQLPLPIAVPGVKLGLSNIITVYAMARLGPAQTLMILLGRIFLGGLFSGRLLALLYSLSGGLLCYCSLLVTRKIVSERQLWVMSAIGAVFHNIGQLAMAALVTKSLAVLVYLPVLLIAGIITGAFTGLCAQLVVNRLGR